MGLVKNPTCPVFCEAQMNSHKEQFWWRKGLEVLTAKKIQSEMKLLHYEVNARAIPQRRRVYYKLLNRNLKEEIRRKERPRQRYTSSSTRTLCKGL